MPVDFQTTLYKIKSLLPGYYRKLSSIETQVKEISESVGNVIKSVDDDFLNLGNGLQSIYHDTDSLTGLIKKTSEIAGSSNKSSNLMNISSFSNEMLEKLSRYQNQISESLQNLSSTQSKLGGLAGLCDNNEKLVTLLNIIALNIAIECNRSEDAKEMFSAFVQEVRKLSEETGSVTSKMGRDIASVIQDQKSSRDIIFKKYNELSKLSVSVEKIVGSTSKKIEDLIASSLDSLDKASLYSSEISRQVGKIVIAIQFHDIVRQKIEHVVSALDEAVELLKNKRLTKDSLGRVFSVLKLQNAQIRVVIGEIDSAYSETISGFDVIEKKVVQLVECINDSSGTEENTEEDNLFSNIVSGMGSLDNLINDAKELNLEMGGIASEASSSARELKKYVSLVQNISLDLHRKALNAIIKSTHLGETGQTLEIFAQEVTKSSQTSDSFANQVIEIINSVSEIADNLEKISEIEVSKDHNNISMDLIVGSYKKFKENTKSAVKNSGEIQSSIEKIKSQITFMAEMRDNILAIVEQSETICGTISDHTGIKEEMKDVVESSSQRYTMESERVVHSNLIGESEEEEELDKKEKKTPQGDEEDLGDNIDLF